MQLPKDFDAGPMSLTEFTELQADETAEAQRNGYRVKVQRVDQDGQIFAKVTYAEEPAPQPVAPAGTAAAMTQLTQASPSQDIAQAIKDAAARFQISADLLAAIVFIESSLNPRADNPKSSAHGLLQFINGTWNARFGAAVGVTVADRDQVRAQCLMGAAFLKENQDALLQGLKRAATSAECYAAHFFGVGTAIRLLVGNQNQPADQALGPKAQQVIDANRSIFMNGSVVRTVKQVLDLFQEKIDGALQSARQLLGPLETA
jgi:uncharacterized protein GlcG (DUF336 family)